MYVLYVTIRYLSKKIDFMINLTATVVIKDDKVFNWIIDTHIEPM